MFPAASIRAASWDMALEKRVGEASGDETAASLNNMLLAPCMNIIRHPYWGRTQETYGEDTYHTGRMATAYTVGLQEYVTGCAKHFAANNVEKNRSSQNAIMNEQTLREIYARHFEMVVQDGGVGCIMASYNKINGNKNTQNKHLLRDILKAPVEQGGMGYQGSCSRTGGQCLAIRPCRRITRPPKVRPRKPWLPAWTSRCLGRFTTRTNTLTANEVDQVAGRGLRAARASPEIPLQDRHQLRTNGASKLRPPS